MTDCPHLRRAVADKLLVLARIEFEPSPRIQYALKLAVQEFEKQIEAHRDCRCQELQEAI